MLKANRWLRCRPTCGVWRAGEDTAGGDGRGIGGTADWTSWIFPILNVCKGQLLFERTMTPLCVWWVHKDLKMMLLNDTSFFKTSELYLITFSSFCCLLTKKSHVLVIQLVNVFVTEITANEKLQKTRASRTDSKYVTRKFILHCENSFHFTCSQITRHLTPSARVFRWKCVRENSVRWRSIKSEEVRTWRRLGWLDWPHEQRTLTQKTGLRVPCETESFARCRLSSQTYLT